VEIPRKKPIHDLSRRRWFLGDPLEQDFTKLKQYFGDSAGRARVRRSWQSHCGHGVRLSDAVGTIALRRKLMPR